VPSLIQRSLAGGIIGPELAGRADQAKYQTGLKDAINVIVQRYGGVTNRSGTRFVAETRHGDAYQCRIIKFVFNTEQTYVLEFGEQYMRVYRNGGAVIPDATAWSNATTYLVGDMASFSGVTYYCIADHLNQTPPNDSYWAPMTPGFYEIPTPYSASDVRSIQYVQSGDVVTLTHPGYAPMELRRTAHTAWTMRAKSFQPTVERPTNCAGTRGASGSLTYRYRVTSFDPTTMEESYPGRAAGINISAATRANPCKLTTAANTYATGDEVFIDGIAGMTELNGKSYIVTVISTTQFTLNGVDSTGFSAYVSGGTSKRTTIKIISCAAPTTPAPIVLTWSHVSDAYDYWVYRYNNGIYEFIGEAPGVAGAPTITFSDNNIASQSNLTPPGEFTGFADTDSYPSSCAYVQQRLILANTNDETERIWMSQVGNFNNFSRSSPVQSDDAIEFQLAGRQVNAVRHLLEVAGKLVVLTDSSEWTVQGDTDGVIRPTAINPRQQGYTGASPVQPVVIGPTAIYTQARGSVICDLRYDFNSDGYQGRDLTIFCPGLFESFGLVACDYQQTPHSVVWVVRDDGAMLGCTYVRDHDVWGWHRHLTAGGDDAFEDVLSVPEDGEDAVYVIVRRAVGSSVSRYVERFATRQFTDIAIDAFFVDSGLTYDGRNTGSTSMDLGGGTNWDETETLACTASASAFTPSNVGDVIVFTAESGESHSCTITGYNSVVSVSVRPDRQLPADLQGIATTSWALAVNTLSGLDHLEGRTVTALVDGSVNTDMLVVGGSVTLDAPATIAHVGLPYTARIETLDAENMQGETWADKKRKIHKVAVKVKDSRGLWLGYGDGQLFEHEDDQAENYGDPIPPFTGLIEENVDTTWEKSGKVVIEQRDPLPMTILAVIPVGSIGGS
jgi:hypothetical protein